MKQKISRSLATLLVLNMVSCTSLPAFAAQSAAGAPRTNKAQGFSIAINETLPDEAPAAQEAAPQPEAVAEEHAVVEEVETTASAEEQNQSQEKGGLFSAWSLPISGPLKLLKHKPAVAQQKNELNGSISFEDPYESTTQYIDSLMEVAWNRDPATQALDKAVNHYRKKTQVVIAESKDAANYVIPFRGFGPSSEAGDIITGEKLKLKSKASAEYARQKHVDELHLKVVSSMMQISMGLGMTDHERGQLVTANGVNALTELVGEEEAEKTKTMLAQMAGNVDASNDLFKKPVWDVQERQKMHKHIMELSLDDDPVIHQINKTLHKYNHRSKFAMVSSSVVQSVLGAASLTPTFVGPAAKTALVAFVMATGGPEQCKLLKELYLDKRLESRCKVLNEEAHLAIDNYQLALLTKNPALLCYSESIVGQMIGGHHVNEVFGTSLLATKKTASAL